MNNLRYLPTQPRRPDDEPAPSVVLSPEDREFVVAKLAEMLVLEYLRDQQVIAPTVAEGSLNSRNTGRLQRMPGPLAEPRRAGVIEQQVST